LNLCLKLPKETEQALALPDSEQIIYSIPYDLTKNGSFCENGFVVVTQTNLFITENNKIIYHVCLSACEKITCSPGVNCALLIVKKDGKETPVAKCSMKYLSRISFLAKGADLFREGIFRKVECLEREKSCPDCGRVLPGTRECPYCGGKLPILQKFWDLCKKYKLKLFLISILMFMSSGVFLIMPEIQKRYIDGVLTKKSSMVSDIPHFILIMLALSILEILIYILRNWWCASLGAKISMDLREQLYFKVQMLSLSYIQERTPGFLMTRIIQDTSRIRSFMQEAFGNMLSVMVTMISTICFMIAINPKLTLLSVVFLPLSFGLSLAWRKNIHKRYHKQWLIGDKINSALQDVISGMRVVKSYGKEKEESVKFNRLSDRFSTVQTNNEVFWAVFYPILTFCTGLGVYFVTYFGGIHVLKGELTVGELTQFAAYAGMLYGPLGWMTRLPRMIVQMLTSLERAFDILDEEPRIQNHINATDANFDGDIEFKNVTFGYHTYKPVLENINLTVKKGEMIGIVGESGSGKSTLINLMMRLYEPDDGEIFLGGKNINEVKIENFHAQIGVVLQETFLFSGTILNNLKFSKPDATFEEIIRAAKAANAHDFICKTPDGYNTYVGERGYTLSGGERQRIAIARAILNNPKLLILDEATSNLDTESEYFIQKALSRLTEGRTTFAIAHRLSTLKNADRLIVIDNHRIAEIGTHNELIEQKGIYYNLVSAQLEMSNMIEEE